MAQSKGTDVVLDQALKAEPTAKYVMFDTWFSNPHQIVQIKQRDLNVIAILIIFAPYTDIFIISFIIQHNNR